MVPSAHAGAVHGAAADGAAEASPLPPTASVVATTTAILVTPAITNLWGRVNLDDKEIFHIQ
ncbi:hypothetical protein GCM10010483_47110 [Actinokineospora diospyrosa]